MTTIKFIYTEFLRLLVSEAIISIFLGTIPTFYLYYSLVDILKFTEQVKSFVAQGFFLIYPLILFCVYVATSLARTIYRNAFFESIQEISSEVGTSLVSVYRTAAGTFIGIPIIWYLAERSTFNLVQSFAIWGFAFGCIAGCSLFVTLYNLFKVKFQKYESSSIRYRLWS